ncbi:amino-acid N-acetyltransferase [Anaerosolibacter carboniphilus]|uniref:Amino-acid N-acetyltransferase n=1 Tax=Anaerosolibacter carboniphilus TaxID=1417629 RepID=A0A841L2Q2_9FIRM|nr:GNAT family N-acetyltransferase [Anaerosolibacter carboniphilus]MBB6216669.1 amino-acid N-acetyltransferase [Anaerosolibacter carboniphilus]
MLTIKNADKQDIFHIQSLSNSSFFENIDIQNMIENSMVAYEGSSPLAAAGYEAFGSVAILRFLIVHRDHQREYLGDGIVKALLNLADRRGIQLMLTDALDCAGFLKKVGFEELSEDQKGDIGVQQVIKNNLNPQHTLLAAKLPDFFLKACRFNKQL